MELPPKIKNTALAQSQKRAVNLIEFDSVTRLLFYENTRFFGKAGKMNKLFLQGVNRRHA
jgi:hypothetical protein|tara:strand:+ start:565 stop:744 length:180 start_codon:yes stop_codon:yes gene_type:complete